MNNKMKRVVAAILAILLIVVMVLSIGVSLVAADSSDSPLEAVTAESLGSTADSTESVSSAEETDTASGQESGSGGSVYVENINVSGMSESQIKTAIREHMNELKQETIVLYAGDRIIRVKAEDLGLTYTNTNIAAEAYSIGREGNVLKRFLADRYMQQTGDIVLDLQFSVSESKIRTVLQENESHLNCDPQSNGLKLSADYTFYMTSGRNGVSVNIDASVQKVVEYMETEWHGGQGGVSLDAVITTYQDASAQLNLVKDLLGTGTTGYQTGDYNHDTNVEIAASHIDGTVLYPDEEFSAEDVIGPTTEEYGFLPGATYEGTEITETYGGGVCQVTSTLYNAVLQAELEVTERHNHSYLVSYVQPAYDSAIAEGLLDFRFKNNTGAPIYIQAVTEDGYLTFHIFGQEYRDENRTFRYENEIGEYTDYETVYVMDSNAEFGTLTVSGGINGLDSRLYKYVSIDGGEETQELVNTSTYSSLPLTYKVGTKNADAATIASISQAVASGELGNIQIAIGNGTVIQQEVNEN